MAYNETSTRFEPANSNLGFEEGKPYAMETANGKHFVTNQYIIAAHGKLTTARPFISCSNSPFTEAEFHRYKQTCLVEDVPIPSKTKLSSKIDDINQLVNRTWTEAELQEKLNRSGALKNKHIPLERTRLTKLIVKARSTGDEDKVASLTAELQALDGPKLAFGTSMKASPRKNVGSQEVSQQEALANLNRENRRKNAEEVRNAQIKERRQYRAIDAALARGEAVAEDHSRRVKTKAKFKHDVADTMGSKPASGTSTPNPARTAEVASTKDPLPHIVLLEKMQSERKGLPTLRRPLCDDDIIGAIDLGIDIEI